MLLIKNKTLRLAAGILETFSFLSIKLLLKKPAKARILPGRMFREYMSLVEDDKWLCQDIFDLYPDASNVRITIEHMQGSGILTPLDQLAYLALLTKINKPKAIFEIGTFRGRTALNFALNSPDDCKIYTLDLPPAEKEMSQEGTNVADAKLIRMSAPGSDYQGKDVTNKIVQLYGNSLKFDFSPYYGKMDMVYVDGAHHYDAVISDTENAMKMIRPGGLVMWDDFANYGDYNDVTRAVLDSFPKNRIIQIANTQLAIMKI